MASDVEVEDVQRIPVPEFDDGASIRVMSDGSLRLKLDSMPPSWAGSRSPFDSFVPAMAEALGVKVIGLDKELFSVPAPKPDTVETLRAWLSSLRQQR